MSSEKDLDDLVIKIQSQFNQDWKTLKTNLPDILAVIFAVWSVSTSKAFFEDSKNMETVLRPHPVQVFLLLKV